MTPAKNPPLCAHCGEPIKGATESEYAGVVHYHGDCEDDAAWGVPPPNPGRVRREA